MTDSEKLKLIEEIVRSTISTHSRSALVNAIDEILEVLAK